MNLLYLNSNVLGAGDKNFGEKLLLNFLTNLYSKSLSIDTIFCINSGAYLTSTNKKSIEILKQFQDKGTIILTCGTCLKFYKLEKKLNVGDIGSMNLLTHLMQNANIVIRP